MSEPTIAATTPAVLALEAGTYYWCACGLSQSQPFCDGSHEATGFMPTEVVLEEETRVALCQCKRTGSPPYCDGSHKDL